MCALDVLAKSSLNGFTLGIWTMPHLLRLKTILTVSIHQYTTVHVPLTVYKVESSTKNERKNEENILIIAIGWPHVSRWEMGKTKNSICKSKTLFSCHFCVCSIINSLLVLN